MTNHEDTTTEHVHEFAKEWTRSRFAGTLHRVCTVPFCRVVSLDSWLCDDCGTDHDTETPEAAVICGLAVCVDCAHMAANGETMEDTRQGFVADYIRETAGYVVALTATDEDHEPWFSWNRCDVCRSHLGGDRFAAALLPIPLRQTDTDTNDKQITVRYVARGMDTETDTSTTETETE